MKKFLAILLSALMMLTLFAGCSDKGSDDDKKDNKKEDTSASEKADSNEDSDEEENLAPAGVNAGSYSGNVYSNSFSGISFTKPSDWDYASIDDLALASAVDADTFTNGDFSEILDKNGIVAVMDASKPGGNPNISISIVDLEASGLETSISEDDFIAAIFEDASSSMGVEFTVSATKATKLGDEWYTSADSSVFYADTALYQRAYVYKQGAYLTLIVSSASTTNALDEIEAMFS